MFSSESSTLIQNVPIESDGSFSIWIETGGCHIGQLTATETFGYYSPEYMGGPDADRCEGGPQWGEFSGSLLSNIGPFSNGAGFYEGTITGEVTLQGNHWADIGGELFVMTSGNGSAFITVDACAIHGTTCTIADDGGFIQLGESGIIDGNLIKGTSISGTFNMSELETPSCCSAQGTFYRELESEFGVFVSSGTWSIEKTIPLPNINDATPKSFPWLMILLD